MASAESFWVKDSCSGRALRSVAVSEKWVKLYAWNAAITFISRNAIIKNTSVRFSHRGADFIIRLNGMKFGSFLKRDRALSGMFLEGSCKIRQTFKTGFETCLCGVIPHKQKLFGFVDPVLIHKGGKGESGHFLEISAKGFFRKIAN